MNSPQSFFTPDGEAFESTELCRGPWSSRHQHGGPPSALMARAIENLPAMDEFQIARMCVEFVKPVPLTRLVLQCESGKEGRTVRTAQAKLLADREVVCQANALAIRRTEVTLPYTHPSGSVPGSPESVEPFVFPFFLEAVGYHVAMEVRITRGTFGKGPVAAWMRMRYPLLPDEMPSPLQRVMIAADSGNGVSPVLDPKDYFFINPDLTVYLHRPPEKEWVCLEALTIPHSSGIGLAESGLYDERGPIGRALQSLVVGPRTTG